MDRRKFVKAAGYLLVGSSATSVLGSTSASAQEGKAYDFFISPQGSDSNPGTLERPWAITALNTKGGQYAGKRVGLLDGTYNLRLLGLQYPNDARGILNVTGGPSDPQRTVIEAVNQHRAIIDADRTAWLAANPGALWGGSVLAAFFQSNVTFRGLKIVGANYWATQVTDGSNITWDSVWVDDQLYERGAGRGANSAAIIVNGTAQPCQNILVTNCRVTNSGAPADPFDANSYRHAGIQTFRAYNTVIENCTVIVHPLGGMGILWKNNDNRASVTRRCYLDASNGPVGATALRWELPDQITGANVMHNNILLARDVAFTNSGVRPFYDPFIVYNNTFVGGASANMLTLASGVGQGVADYYNNILFRRSLRAIGGEADIVLSRLADARTFNFNAYGSSSAPLRIVAGTAYNGLAAWRAASGKDSNSLAIDEPLFTATGIEAERYRLQAGSPCRNAGRVGGVGTGAVTDLGAWGGGATRIGAVVPGVSRPEPPPSLSIS